MLELFSIHNLKCALIDQAANFGGLRKVEHRVIFSLVGRGKDIGYENSWMASAVALLEELTETGHRKVCNVSRVGKNLRPAELFGPQAISCQ